MSRDESHDDAERAAEQAEDAVLRHAEGQPPRAGEEQLFAALDRTRADLAAAPVPPVPPGFAARLQERLAAERAAAPSGGDPDDADHVDDGRASGRPPAPSRPPSQLPSSPPSRSSSRPPSSPPSPGPAGRGPRGPLRRRTLAAALGALAVVAAVVVGVLAGTTPAPPTAPTAAPPVPGPPAPGPAPVSAADPVRALRAGLGAADPGPLGDPARRAACLVAHGLPAGTVPLGTRQVLLDGRPGTLLVLTTGRAARFRLLVVGPGCTADRPDTLADLTVGG
ncbi:hypothetical protein [Actinomycetospora sp. TBRC 11914]|uniref:hypothetical protein n=1 Tax=Actinomycetospora sp. TBRC 11914 TaxID=2729387 RepID=UPI00145F76CC|nr:hypothetical protein [Actinomycetospora sp. TBRC 11914]NMO90276.1 hypothetical protein [Actinomycetospora sp. TBRC 11914]